MMKLKNIEELIMSRIMLKEGILKLKHPQGKTNFQDCRIRYKKLSYDCYLLRIINQRINSSSFSAIDGYHVLGFGVSVFLKENIPRALGMSTEGMSRCEIMKEIIRKHKN